MSQKKGPMALQQQTLKSKKPLKKLNNALPSKPCDHITQLELSAFRQSLGLTFCTDTMSTATLPYKFLDTTIVKAWGTTITGKGISIAAQEDEDQEDRNPLLILTPYLLKGEKAKVKLINYCQQTHHAESDLVEILEKVSLRQDAPCQYFGQCSGCQLQHLSYEEQLRWKQEVYAKIFSLTKVKAESHSMKSIEASPLQFNYRSKIDPHANRIFAQKDAKERSIGFQMMNRRTILDIEQCMIASRSINSKYQDKRNDIRIGQNAKYPANKSINLFFRDDFSHVKSKDLAEESSEFVETTTDQNKKITEIVGKYRFKFRAGSFFQCNASILPKLVSHIKDCACQDDIEYFVDTYCGAGLFAISCHESFKKVMGIENDLASVIAAKENATLNDAHNCEFIHGDATDIFDKVKGQFPPQATTVMMDPSRKGCSESFISQLLQYGPQRLIYLSCHATTQARDLCLLTNQLSRPAHIASDNAYDILEWGAWDFFPQTSHIEGLVILNKTTSSYTTIPR